MKTYTICGSMRFENEMREIAGYLETELGFNILQCTYSGKGSVKKRLPGLPGPITGKSI